MNKYSLEEISKLGEKIYFERLQNKLEPFRNGEYAVIDVETGDYFVDEDRLKAVEIARQKNGNKLFYIVQIGNLKESVVNFKKTAYAWNI